jgi:hypothetical protein
MDANFVLFCFVFLGALLLISFDALGEHHDDDSGVVCDACSVGVVYDDDGSLCSLCDALLPMDSWVSASRIGRWSRDLREWAEDSGFTFVDDLFVDEDGNTWTPDSLFDFMVEVTDQE